MTEVFILQEENAILVAQCVKRLAVSNGVLKDTLPTLTSRTVLPCKESH
jgi:hypothetical protein